MERRSIRGLEHLKGKQRSAVNPMVDQIRAAFGSRLVGLVQFGSSVRGEMRVSSDIDLLVVMHKKIPVDRSLYQIWDRHFASRDFDIFSPQFSHLPGPDNCSSLWLEIALEGEILLDATGAVQRTLAAVRAAIAIGQYTRKMSHGHPYWVRRNKEVNAE